MIEFANLILCDARYAKQVYFMENTVPYVEKEKVVSATRRKECLRYNAPRHIMQETSLTSKLYPNTKNNIPSLLSSSRVYPGFFFS